MLVLQLAAWVLWARLSDAQPHTTITLWKAHMDEAKFEDPDPAMIILDNSTKTQIKLAPEKRSYRMSTPPE